MNALYNTQRRAADLALEVKTTSGNTFRADAWAQSEDEAGTRKREESDAADRRASVNTQARWRNDELCPENHKQLGSWSLDFVLQATGSPRRPDLHPIKLRAAAAGKRQEAGR